MNEQTIELALVQIAVLLFTSVVLIVQPDLAIIIICFLLIILAFSLAAILVTALPIIFTRHSSRSAQFNGQQSEEQSCKEKLTTHLGGIVCYMVILDAALRQLS